MSFASFKTNANVALSTNNCAFSNNLFGALLSKTVDAVVAKSLEDEMLAWLLQEEEEDNGDRFLVASCSRNKGRGGRFAPTSFLVNESSGNLCATNFDVNFNSNNGGGFMIASSPVNQTVDNNNSDGGGG